MPAPQPEPWLRNTHVELPAVVRGVKHALEQAEEDIALWCGQLSAEQLESRPLNLPSAAFQMRHITGSLDRLLTYAEEGVLSAEQLRLLAGEQTAHGSKDDLFAAFANGMAQSMVRVESFQESDLESLRFVGRARLPVTLGGLLVHIAEHTQRHVGQAITTVKAVLAIS